MKNVLIACLLTTYAACGNIQEAGMTGIAGKLENATGNETITFQNNGKLGKVDSATVNTDGSFLIKVKNMPLDFYKLTVNESSVLLIMDSTQKVLVQGDANDFRSTYSVQGSPDSELLVEQVRKDDEFRKERKELEKAFKSLGMNATQEQKEKYIADQNALMEPYYNYLINFIDEHPKSPACITVSNNLHPIQELERYKKIRENLKDVIPMSNSYLSLKKKIADSERQAKELKAQEQSAKAGGLGNEAPEIDLPNPEGVNVPLSSFRGKYVLVDFWASWCGPCRRENPNVVKLYEKYKDDGFEVYGVSLDSNKDRWIKAIAQDRLSWTHVSDLAKWNSIAARAYGVRSIPHTVLLDKEGNIMSIKLRGAALEAKLAELFGH
ncbi:MAG: TlpA disulfide reductase family protein [Bacteroidota bacterium]